MTQYIPVISASAVASIIGLNKYRPVEQAMYEVLIKDKEIKERIYRIQRETNRKSIMSFKNMVLADQNVKDVVTSSLTSCNGLEDLTPVLKQAETSASAVLALKYENIPASLHAVLKNEVSGQIARQRGSANEDGILEQYEKDNNVQVIERNTKSLKKRA